MADMFDKYREYFDIDPEYFPQVNEAIINGKPELWKKFYPHETFVKLVKDIITVISRKQRVSIWVEGAYGTGKSHAVLTLKKLLDAGADDTKDYFEKYKEQLSTDLYKQFQQLKSGKQRILTVHRYGASSIRGDNSLVFAIQDSIVNAMKEIGIDNAGVHALKYAAVKWLSDETNKQYFNTLMKSPQYTDMFAGEDVDGVIEDLNSYSGDALQELMGKVMRVAEERQFRALYLDVDGLVEWIREVIREHDLKAIVFIWDEFTEYFRNNRRALTGFQKIVDMSGSDPFYCIIVTHNVSHIFLENDDDWKKILDRFLKPVCNIELPENMAFGLMKSALKISSDTVVQEEWEDIADELYERTDDARSLVKGRAHITDDELKSILPIHPYTALMLKHISSAFDSNQRSMFDFIKNDHGDEIKGFQWFIDNFGPHDENPLLTIDMLWDFFYEKGKEYLSHDIRQILDSYYLIQSKDLGRDDKRVFKTLLLLQAISQRTGDTVELFIPNEKNLNYAFEGSDLENDEASRIANSLVPDVLFRKPMGGGKFQYSALVSSGNVAELAKQKEQQKEKSTETLISEGNIGDVMELSGPLRLRYEIKRVSVTSFKTTVRELENNCGESNNRIMAVIAFAKDDTESTAIGKYIQEAVENNPCGIVFIDASITPLGADLMEQYAEAMANSVVNLKQNRTLGEQYEKNAEEVLKKWRKRIADGEFIIYTADRPKGERIPTKDALHEEMMAIDRKRYPDSLETGSSVTDVMWLANMMPSGVEYGAKRAVQGQYKSQNENTKLENYIGRYAWEHEQYWKDEPYTLISRIKIAVEKVIKDAFDRDGRVSIERIYRLLKESPYGFMPCNLTAFVMGFVLKEYAVSTYSWSDGLTNDVMSVGKLKEMVAEILKHTTTPIPRYKDKFIVAMTEEEKSFNRASSSIFAIEKSLCTSIEQTRERIRQKMKELLFPVWCLEAILDDVPLQSDKKIVEKLINGYTNIANNHNTSQTDSDIAMDIGKLCLENPLSVNDLANLVSRENCKKGMQTYLAGYKDGRLPMLASSVGDNGQYINRLRGKFDADAANWVWNKDTADDKIDEVILEYEIIEASNRILPQNVDFDNTVREWSNCCNRIRVSYLYGKSNWEELSGMMELLYMVKKSEQMFDSQRKRFLEEITVKGERFKDFYHDQTGIFKKACSFILSPYSDEEIHEIFSMLPLGVFTSERDYYQNIVEETIKRFDSEKGAAKLKKYWTEKTGTENPKKWSTKYITPILCMVPEKEVTDAKKAFAAVCMKQPDRSSVERTLEYFEKADFFDRLSNKEERDKAFKKNIIKSYAVLLDDVDDVRNYLDKVMTPEPFEWFGLPEIDTRLKEMAEYKYHGGGCERALEKIDGMDITDVKRYLKELIRDNMIVGMEIIKNN